MLVELATNLTSAVDGIEWDASRVDACVKSLLQESRQATPEQLASALGILVERIARSKVDDADGVAHVAISAGTLVEQGAPSEPLGEVLLARFPEVLIAARRFGDRCLAAMGPETDEEQDVPEDEVLVYLDNRPVRRTLFREHLSSDRAGGAALAYLEQWSLPAVAAWTRSREMLRRAVGDEELRRRAAVLSDSDAGFVDLLLGVQLDAPWIALAPLQSRGFRLTVDAVVSNFELHALLAATLVPRGIPGPPNPPDVIAVLRGDVDACARDYVAGSWNLYTPQAAAFDLTQPNQVPHEHWVWNEGRPNDVPMVDGARTVLVGPPAYERTWGIGRTFHALRPRVEIVEEMPTETAREWLQRFGGGTGGSVSKQEPQPAPTPEPCSGFAAGASHKPWWKLW